MLALVASPVAAQAPSIAAQPGKPFLYVSMYDLSALGYQTQEYFLSGTATSYQLAAPAGLDGRWNVVPAATAPYTTRIVVIRPTDPAKFNGTVLVEWLNVSAGQDIGADWMVAHREMIRKGYAYVAVSAQKVGVEGGNAVMGPGGAPLKTHDPQRYGSLSHPGDAFSYDMYSQVGALLKAPQASGVLGPLVPQRVLAIGESQSAAFLTTYVNAVDRLAKVYDGFLVHSRFGSGAGLDGARMNGGPGAMPAHGQYRTDLRVPVMTVITETDLLGGRLPGYYGARRPDDNLLRVWEVAGASHADNYLFGGAMFDSGLEGSAALAKFFVPTANSQGGKVDQPFNPGLPHHYVVEAALAALDHWVRTGQPPASTPVLAATGSADAPSLTLDANGLAEGGVRTPWVDVPTIRLSGVGNSGGSPTLTFLVGLGVPFDKATLAKLYPGGKADYLAKFQVALDRAIGAGHILPEDRQEILDIAAINFDTVP